jgi:hypothetical protein
VSSEFDLIFDDLPVEFDLTLGHATQGRPLRWASSRHAFDGLLAISARTDGLVSRRTKPLLADGNDDLLLMINLSGVGRVALGTTASAVGVEAAAPA